MKTNKEIVTEIIKDLEKIVGLNWPIRKDAKVSKEKLIDCWSAYRKDSEYNFYNYTHSNSLGIAYKKIFINIIKNNIQSWKNYILNLYNYKYCYKCGKLKKLNEFTLSKHTMSNHESECKDCKKNYYQNNKENILERSKKHYQNNKEKYAAKDAKRRAAKLNRTPAWLTEQDLKDIESFYTKTQELTEETGIQHHVDHIIPLQGELISGLHVPSNLQILPAKENLQKGNKFEVI